MTVNPFTLKFCGPDQALEKKFQEYYFNNSLSMFRWGFFFGLFLYSVFGIVDFIFMPEVKEKLWLIRYGIVGIVGFSGLLISFHPKFIKYWQFTTMIIILSAAIGIYSMILIGEGPSRFFYFNGILLVFFFGFTLIRARFVWAVATNILILAMFGITVWLVKNCPLPVTLANFCSMLATFAIGAVANYSMEFFVRKNFHLMHRLKTEENNLKAANQLLKEQFEELQNAEKKIRVLSGLIPICAECKRIRDVKGQWNQLETYISKHSDATFSHSVCPECMKKLYGNEDWFKRQNPDNTQND